MGYSYNYEAHISLSGVFLIANFLNTKVCSVKFKLNLVQSVDESLY